MTPCYHVTSVKNDFFDHFFRNFSEIIKKINNFTRFQNSRMNFQKRYHIELQKIVMTE